MKKEIRIVGPKKSGKTTLIENLSKELKSRGYRVAAVKHTSHDHEFDRPGTDSWRFRQSGCETAVIISPDNFVCHADHVSGQKQHELFELLFQDIDILFYEGKGEDEFPLIACAGRDHAIIEKKYPGLLAVVSDEEIDTTLPIFKPNKTSELADILIEKLKLTKQD